MNKNKSTGCPIRALHSPEGLPVQVAVHHHHLGSSCITSKEPASSLFLFYFSILLSHDVSLVFSFFLSYSFLVCLSIFLSIFLYISFILCTVWHPKKEGNSKTSLYSTSEKSCFEVSAACRLVTYSVGGKNCVLTTLFSTGLPFREGAGG